MLFNNEICAILGENNDNDQVDSAIEGTITIFTITRTINEEDNVNKWFN